MQKAKSAQYPLPGFLEGICTVSVYDKWLDNKADTLLKRDKKRRKPYARAATDRLYKEKIHKAIIDNGRCDPFTGDPLDWKLIKTWDTSSTHGLPKGRLEYFRFYLYQHPEGYKNP